VLALPHNLQEVRGSQIVDVFRWSSSLTLLVVKGQLTTEAKICLVVVDLFKERASRKSVASTLANRAG
jgi:hypothetical protein